MKKQDAPTWLPLGQSLPSHTDTLRAELGAHDADASEPTEMSPVEIGGELGRGGMGVVYRGRQTRLGRAVAVKVPLMELHGAADALLIREGRIAGGLEHPNIVPVHDLVMGVDGRPQLILKCIDGVAWDEVIAHPARIPEEGKLDPLGWHLGVFLQVCNAIAFAHAHEVLHRDIKPANVLVGRFGEVCVVDWGVAVSMKRDGEGRLIDAVNQSRLVGTLAYMPPEMFRADAAALGVWSDVYLLGSTLFHVIEGRPPRDCRTIDDYREQVDQEVAVPSGWPAGLRSLVLACMDVNTGRRPSIAALQQAVRTFIDQRAAESLLDGVDDKIAELREHTSQEGERDTQATFKLYGSCQFVLQEVLRRWPDHRRASEARDQLLELMVDHELRHSGHAGATVVLAQWPDVPSALRARVAAAAAAAVEDESARQHVMQDSDRLMGRFERLGILTVTASVVLGLPVALALVGVERGYQRIFLQNTLFLSVILVGAAVLYRPHYNTHLNRSVFGLMTMSQVLGLVLAAVLWMLEADVHTLTVLRALQDGFVVLIGAVLVERRLWPAALAMVAAPIAAEPWPSATTPLLMGATFFLAFNTVYVWVLRPRTHP